jgi:hypothetical protein
MIMPMMIHLLAGGWWMVDITTTAQNVLQSLSILYKNEINLN